MGWPNHYHMAGEINATQSYIISLFVILKPNQLQVNKQMDAQSIT